MTDPTPMQERTPEETIARALCREQCAFRGEPPCFLVEDNQGDPLPWPNPNCDEPGCHALAAAAVEALAAYDEWEAAARARRLAALRLRDQGGRDAG